MKKIDLHLHLDGSLRPSTILEYALQDNLVDVNSINHIKELVQVKNDNQDLTEYLSKFSLPIQILNSAERLERAGFEIIEDLYQLGYIYAEIRFAPQLHLHSGLNLKNIVDYVLLGMQKASIEFNFPFGLILCSMRHMPVKNSIDIIQLANSYINTQVVGVDLAGDELNFPPEIFSYSFKQSKLPITIHAGEALGADSVMNAIKLGASRIGHGIRSIEDNNVIDTLLENNIALEICPKSNEQTNVYSDFSQYPVKQLFDYGIPLTLNSDNLTVSNTSFDNEVLILKNKFGFIDNDIYSMIKNSILHSFACDNTKSDLISNI